MSDDNNPSKQAEADASPNVEPDHHVEGAPNANNSPLTASPNDFFCRKKASMSYVSRNSTLNQRARRQITFRSKLS
jgi:hypothetical protein